MNSITGQSKTLGMDYAWTECSIDCLINLWVISEHPSSRRALLAYTGTVLNISLNLNPEIY